MNRWPGLLLTTILSLCLIAPLQLGAQTDGAQTDGAESVAVPPTVLITGANRGLGLEFARQYADRGYRIIATARRPDSADELQALAADYPLIAIEALDVTDFEQIDLLAEKYRGQPIDILLNNAGITGDPFKTQVFGKIDYSVYDQIMHVNALAPLKMAEAFYDHVLSSEQKKIITVSSSMGSIATTFGTGYFYRSSKSALNMMMATLAKEKRKKGIIVGLMNPGAVATDMMAAMKGRMELRDPVVAAADVIRNIDNLTVETTGSFVEYDGTPLPW